MNEREHRVLVVDDDDSFRRTLTAQLDKAGHETVEAEDGRAALEVLENQQFDLILTDLQMPELDGLELLAELTRRLPETPVVVISAYATVDNAIEALRQGAYDFLTKPFEREELLTTVGKALEIQDLRKENRQLRSLIQEQYDLEGMVGRSGRMQEVYRIARRVSATDATVLVQGESGTGKELLARSIHVNSARTARPFVPINCGAIPESLLESELFGHVKGAFTGATRDKDGKFQAAEGGTVFLDEVSELPLQVQVRLLRVLQERTVDKVGAEQPVPVDVRVIAATNVDLKKAVAAGRFREDLYYRLCVVPIKLPPLRERREDIPLLFDHFLRVHSREQARPMVSVDPEVYSRLQDYSWPGNVRELENTVERMLVMTDSDRITADQLPDNVGSVPPEAGRLADRMLDTGLSLDEMERQLLEAALARNEGNQSQAARSLGITRNTLIYRMQKYGIEG
ncbi:MAG: sigma-54 dependent transcriptional regulator [bacterium]